MKKYIMVLVLILIWSIPNSIGGISWAGKSDKKQYRKDNKGKYHRVYEKEHPCNHQKGKMYSHYNKRYNMKYNGNKYHKHYTWREWKRERHHPKYRHGIYHHDDNGYLMFSFCEKDKENKVCFSVSID